MKSHACYQAWPDLLSRTAFPERLPRTSAAGNTSPIPLVVPWHCFGASILVSLAAAVPKRVQVGKRMCQPSSSRCRSSPRCRKPRLALHRTGVPRGRRAGSGFRLCAAEFGFVSILDAVWASTKHKRLTIAGMLCPAMGYTGKPGYRQAFFVSWASIGCRAKSFYLRPAQSRSVLSRASVGMPMRFGRGLVRITRFRWHQTAVISTGAMPIPTPYSFWIARRAGATSGYIVTFSGTTEGVAHIVDLLAQPGDSESASALLRAGVQSALDSGIQVIETWTLRSGAESVGSHILKRACPLVYKPHLHVAVRFLDV